MAWRIILDDCRRGLRTLPADTVQCCITSPPYWGLRDYSIAPQIWDGDEMCSHVWSDEQRRQAGGGQPGSKQRWQHVGQGPSGHPAVSAGATCTLCGAWRGCLGLEPTPEDYVRHIVEVFREVKRVLRPGGTLWLNLGDCYATGAGRVGDCPGGGAQGARWAGTGGSRGSGRPKQNGRGESQVMPAMGPMTQPNRLPIPGLKPKDLVGIPWRVAFALQADGWWLRSDIVWSKPNPMPESVADRPTKAHEYLFLLAKSESYYYDKDAILEPHTMRPQRRPNGHKRRQPAILMPEHTWSGTARDEPDVDGNPAGRNRRSVWTIGTRPFKGAHFATFPCRLVEPCILAGTSEHGQCTQCGAPFQRVVRKTFVPRGDVSLERGVRGVSGQKPMDRSSRWQGSPRGTTRFDTIGWRPTCKCKADSVPQVVLDPFSGAGTVGLVATRWGRDFIGIEVSPEYVQLSEQRITDDAPLFNRARKAG